MSPRSFKPCPECGGQRVEVEAGVPDAGRGMYVVLKGRRFSFFSRKGESHLMTLTCLQCGYTAWYATELHNLNPDEK